MADREQDQERDLEQHRQDDELQKDGAVQGEADGAGASAQADAQPAAGAERSGLHWWELRPDMGAKETQTGGKAAAGLNTGAGAGLPGAAHSAEAAGYTASFAQLLAAAETAAGREPSNHTSSGESSGTTDPLGETVSGGSAGTRTASIVRKTNETDIKLAFSVDGSGRSDIETDVPFLNHMLDLFTKHGQFDLRVDAKGDIEIDDHHTVEDIGICLGQTLRQALGDKKGIKRYASVFVPMDEALAQVVIDISNRPHFEYRAQYPSAQVGSFSTELVHEFLWKFALEARMTLHVIVHYGMNTHHMIEAVFKALGRALDEATTVDPRVQGVPSTKGVL